ncbi:ABC-type nitrate/sulfonate/bicarbonate transport system, permease component [Quadrisphaera granulorum]|uniref:ABC-type nitrate/sulfonate/bicarbonate transport system permease component n=1 Tax=Quadrisphaera granulorum TaxID=317664 RepID=A0A316ADC9_9ACTN|nr:ABC transporter permease subunit [Quadrisphaera granulorum]PWJ55419.1 ABC-type nitrate/sulfonate/bicarbonate transport system permease component [Quadrisphaera granulorum]SZE95483.1 ABC-type nitrate/sulfonate/bicarbonate transport system, permease component [Quadrisphaera granulorum]
MSAPATTPTSTAPAKAPAPPAGDSVNPAAHIIGTAVWRAFRPLVVSAVVALVVWWGFLAAFEISPFVGKTPQAVWAYLVTDADAAANRATIAEPLGVTLQHALIGFVAGMLAALIVGGAFVASSALEQSLMPIAMLLRSVPLVAMTPIIVLIFGRGLGSIAVMGGIVVFFPALVNVVQGLRSVPPTSRDLVHAYGGSDLAVMRRVGIPTAMPAIFAAVRISVPGALTGALVVEWLATGDGIGSQILSAIGGFRYDEVWALIVAVTATSVVLYTLVGLLEGLVLARYAPHRLTR